MRNIQSAIKVIWKLFKVRLLAIIRPKKEAAIQQQMEEAPRYKNPVLNTARLEFERRGGLIKRELETYIIPDDKLEVVVEACIKTLIQHAHMTDQRIVRKVAEQYKLKKRMQAV